MAGFGQVFLVKPWNLPGQAKFSLNTLMQTSEATQITARLATSLATPQVEAYLPYQPSGRYMHQLYRRPLRFD